MSRWSKEGCTLLEKGQTWCLSWGELRTLCSCLHYSLTVLSNICWQEWYPLGNSTTDHLQPQRTHCNPHLLQNIWRLLGKPPLDEKPSADPFLRLIAQELYVAFLSLCNFLLPCVLKVKTLSFLLGDICHWTIKVCMLESLPSGGLSDAKTDLWCTLWP